MSTCFYSNSSRNIVIEYIVYVAHHVISKNERGEGAYGI